MEEHDAAPGYHIWGIDNTAYGPIELPTLVNWIKEERVLANTWVFVETETAWCPAQEVSELKLLFKKKRNGSTPIQAMNSRARTEPGDLRRIRALAEMSDDQLTALLSFVEIVEVRQFSHVVKRGDPGDAMYGVLGGELRSCILVDGKECPVSTLGPGSIFGEISLFDRGPHAAEVIANQDSILMKLSAQAVSKISKEAPEAAFAMLMGLTKAIAGRVRTLTKRYEDSVHNAHRAETLHAA
jgi:CRP-like cAMP-binding protein